MDKSTFSKASNTSPVKDEGVLKPETNDDWSINVNPYPIVPVSSFIRIFMINRIIFSAHNKTRDHYNLSISKLLNTIQLKDNNYKQQQKPKAQTVLSHLMRYGIKHFMKNAFDEREHCDTIELLFNQIILIQFKKEYYNITRYISKNNQFENKDDRLFNIENQNKVFNTKDLIDLILQYLEWDWTSRQSDELLNCSLVNSCWLYHSWQVKPTRDHEIILDEIIQHIVPYTVSWHHNYFHDNSISRMNDKVDDKLNSSTTTGLWQRLIHVKSIKFNLSQNIQIIQPNWEILLNRIAMLQNVLIINCMFEEKHIEIFKVLMQNCQNKSQRMIVNILQSSYTQRKNVLSPLYLPNAKKIKITGLGMYFYYIWTSRCQILDIRDIEHEICLDKHWLEFVIDKCDCSGIKTFRMVDITIDNNVPSDLLKKFALQFENLKMLEIKLNKQNNASLIAIWTYLQNIISKNETNASFSTRIGTAGQDLANYTRLCNMINNNGSVQNTSINQMELVLTELQVFPMNVESVQKLIANDKLQWLSIYNCEQTGYLIKNILNCFHNENAFSKMESIEMIEIRDHWKSIDTKLSVIIDFLSMKLIRARKIFFMTKFMSAYGTNVSITFDDEFEGLCIQIHNLLIKERMAINVSITFPNMRFRSRLNDIFLKYFDEEKILEKYVEPDGDHLQRCQTLDKPIMSLVFNRLLNRAVFCVCSAQPV